MRQSQSAMVLVTLMVLGAAIIGFSSITNPGVAVPLSVEFLVFFALTRWWITKEPDADARRFLLSLFLAAIGLRFLLAVIIHFQIGPYFFAPDAIAYERIGRQISDYWMAGAPAPQAIRDGWRPGYYHLNALVDVVLGDSALALVMVNMFAGVWTALLTFMLTRDLLGFRPARASAVLAAFFPSLVLWSLLNIRDALATVFVVAIVLYGARLAQRYRVSDLWPFLIGVLGLTLLRDYMAFLVMAGLLMGILVSARADRIVPRLIFGTVVVIGLTILAERVGLFSSVVADNPLAAAELMREGLQRNAVSAFGVGADTQSIGGALRYLPLGIAYLLFAPFPWAVDTTLQLTAVPETLLWYPLFLLSLQGLRLSLGRGAARLLIPGSVLLVVVSSYALVEGNFGTAYRHRAQIMPLFFVFTGVGVYWVQDRVLRQTRLWRSRIAGRGSRGSRYRR